MTSNDTLTDIEREMLDELNTNFFLTMNGERQTDLTNLDFMCPFCGRSWDGPRGALIELAQWRRDEMSRRNAVSSPIKRGNRKCPGCENTLTFMAQVLL